ncbi:MAG TPA: HAD hydrolase-like protein [Thermoplasmata archaeon]|nr:HAD hydrolase-like protein [Thermoplasmata archaeon]
MVDAPPGSRAPPADVPPDGEDAEIPLPIVPATSHHAEIERPPGRPRIEVPPQAVARGVVVFDLDGTILDDMEGISRVAGAVMEEAFGTPPEEGRIHYLATTGMPFEAQLAQLYPAAPAARRSAAARTFHQRKVTEAYAQAKPFPEVPKLLKRLGQERWTLAVSTGAETEMAELLLEREGLRFWFEEVLGSAEGTKREHLREYRRRFPGVPIFLVGDSRFDMEAAHSVEGVRAIGRASLVPGWSLTPNDLEQWGAVWADYQLGELPEVLARLTKARRAAPGPAAPRRRRSARAR